MGSEWEEVTLEDSMGAVIDYRGKTPRKTSSGIPLITAKIVKGGRIETPDEFIAEEDYVDWMRRGVPECGDVVVTTEAPLGEVAQLGNERVALAQRLICLRGNPGVLNNNFLKFLMQSNGVQEQLRSRATGTTVLGIKQSELRKVILPMPPLATQRAIAHILGTLDHKIELNRRMNETLEAMARALFKSWFVDFDPVRAKMDGRWRDGESLPGLPAEHYDLFPDRLVDSELGEIPEGWEVESFSEIVTPLKDNENPATAPDVIFTHFSIPAYDEGQIPKRELGESIKSAKSRVPHDVVLLSKLNPEIERVWLVDVASDERAICSTEFLVLRARPPFQRSYVYCLVRSPLFRQQIDSLVTGTSKSHQRAQAGAILSLDVAIPPTRVIEKFEASVSDFLSRSLASRRESRTLAAQRDALLPKLLSGDVRVGEVV